MAVIANDTQWPCRLQLLALGVTRTKPMHDASPMQNVDKRCMHREVRHIYVNTLQASVPIASHIHSRGLAKNEQSCILAYNQCARTQRHIPSSRSCCLLGKETTHAKPQGGGKKKLCFQLYSKIQRPKDARTMGVVGYTTICSYRYVYHSELGNETVCEYQSQL